MNFRVSTLASVVTTAWGTMGFNRHVRQSLLILLSTCKLLSRSVAYREQAEHVLRGLSWWRASCISGYEAPQGRRDNTVYQHRNRCDPHDLINAHVVHDELRNGGSELQQQTIPPVDSLLRALCYLVLHLNLLLPRSALLLRGATAVQGCCT